MAERKRIAELKNEYEQSKLTLIELEAQSRNVLRRQLAEAWPRISESTVDELKEIVKDPQSRAIDIVFANMILDTVTRRDYTGLQMLLDRLLGKPRTVAEIAIDHTGLSPESQNRLSQIFAGRVVLDAQIVEGSRDG